MNKLTRALLCMAAIIAATIAMSTVAFGMESAITVPEKYYSSDSSYSKTYTYTNSNYLGNYEYGLIIPIKVSGACTIRVNMTYSKMEEDVFGWLYTDAACTNSVTSLSAYMGTTNKEELISVTNGGTYYLKFYSIATSSAKFTNTFNLSICSFSYSDKNISSGQTVSICADSYSRDLYFKFKATKTGKATVSLSAGGYVILTNAKKKEISDQEYIQSSGGKFSFAVKKGSTYYLKISGSSETVNTLGLKNTKVKEKSGSSKSKAVAIKAKKKIKGTITAGSKKADWYKIKLNKKKKLTLQVTGELSGYLDVTVYAGSKYVGSSIITDSDKTLEITNSTSYGKADKGTYYVKVERHNKTSSGAYTLKWK